MNNTNTDGAGAGRPRPAAPPAEPTASISLDDTGTADSVRLHAQGEFDGANCDIIPAAVAGAIAAGHHTITVDLAEVSFIDAATVGALRTSGDLAEAAGATLHVANAAGIVAFVLAVTDVPHQLTRHPPSVRGESPLPAVRTPRLVAGPHPPGVTAATSAELAATSAALIDRARAIRTDTRRIIAAINH